MIDVLARLDRALERSLHFLIGAISTVVLALMVLLVAYQVTSRVTNLLPYVSGTEELARGLFIWLVLLGAAAGVRERSHFAVELFTLRAPLARRLLQLFVALVILTCAVVLLVYGWTFMLTGLNRRSLATGLPAIWSYAAIFVGGALMTLFAVRVVIQVALSPVDDGPHPSCEA